MNGSPSAPPATPICHLCGKNYGTQSLPLHIPKCKEKFLLEQTKLPSRLRKQPPDMDVAIPSIRDAAGIEAYNDRAFEIFNLSALTACPNCGRSFNVDALLKHMERCAASSSPSKSKRSSMTSTSSSASGSSMAFDQGSTSPVALTCHLCCRDFGTQSLHRHIPVCEDKFRKRIAALPVQLRPSKTPQPPSITFPPDFDPASVSSHRSMLDAYNAEAREIYGSQVRIACPHCNRRFDLDTCVAHIGSCTKNDSRMDAYEAERAYKLAHAKGPRFLMCHLCGKQFMAHALPLHLKNYCEKHWLEMHPGKPLPAAPAALDPSTPVDLEAYNSAASQQFSEATLVPCEHCGRTFLPDRLVVHQRSCTADKPAVKKAASTRASASTSVSGNKSSLTETSKSDSAAISPAKVRSPAKPAAKSAMRSSTSAIPTSQSKRSAESGSQMSLTTDATSSASAGISKPSASATSSPSSPAKFYDYTERPRTAAQPQSFRSPRKTSAVPSEDVEEAEDDLNDANDVDDYQGQDDEGNGEEQDENEDDSGQRNSSTLPRFCIQCGEEFPTSAKFCPECGCRRSVS